MVDLQRVARMIRPKSNQVVLRGKHLGAIRRLPQVDIPVLNLTIEVMKTYGR